MHVIYSRVSATKQAHAISNSMFRLSVPQA